MSQRPQTFFFFFEMKANPLNLFDRGSWSEISSSFVQKIAAAFQTAHLLPEPPFFDFFFFFFPFSSRSAPLTKEGKKRLKKRQRQENRSLSNALHRTMNFPRHSNVSAECLSDSLQQILKCDNGPQKWVMLSFCWFHFPDPPYPPGLCTSIN